MMADAHPTLPTAAIVLNRDLLFGSRLRGALKGLGLHAQFVRDAAQFVAALEAAGETAAIGIIDMNQPIAWETVQAGLTRSEQTVPTLAFGPHTDAETRRAAKAAGVTRIVSNGQFQGEMAALIDRYRRQ